MINDSYKMTGDLLVVLTDQNGDLKQHSEVKNLIVSAGKEYVCNRLKADASTYLTHMAVGTDATPAAGGDTALLAEVARVAFTSATVSTNTITFVANYPAGTATGTLREAGLFNDVAAGTMLSRTASINVVKGATDTLTITWTVTVS